MLEKLVDPFISTVYSGDPARLSLRSVFPAIHAAAADAGAGGLAGAFIRGRIAARKAPQPARSSSASLPNFSSLKQKLERKYYSYSGGYYYY